MNKQKSTQGTPSWRDVLPIHPACALFPQMSEAELRELGEDIKKHGLKQPIVLWSESPETKHKASLLDGRNRLDAAERAGVLIIDDDGTLSVELPHAIVEIEVCYSFDPDPYAAAARYNYLRRHLTQEQREEFRIRYIAACPGKSDRQIAKELGVTDKTVAAARIKGTTCGAIPNVETRTDTQGRRQPSSKPPRRKKTAADPAPGWRETAPTPQPALIWKCNREDGTYQAADYFVEAVVGLFSNKNDYSVYQGDQPKLSDRRCLGPRFPTLKQAKEAAQRDYELRQKTPEPPSSPESPAANAALQAAGSAAPQAPKQPPEAPDASTISEAGPLAAPLPDTPSALAKLINDKLAAINAGIAKIRDSYIKVLRHSDKRQRVNELLALIAALDLTLSDLDVTNTLKGAQIATPAGDLDRIPPLLDRRDPAPADPAEAGSEGDPAAAGDAATTKH
jgi:hypothetical protein